jgi:hypothetical protein
MSALSSILSTLSSANSNVLNALGGHLTSSSSMAASVNALLQQALVNPPQAATIAAQIAAVPGVPAGVLAYVNELAMLSRDHTAYVEAITQAQAALASATSSGTLGSILSKL